MNEFKTIFERKIMLEGEIELRLLQLLPNSIRCDLITPKETVENLFLHRNITNKLLKGAIKELYLQQMDDGKLWGAVLTRW